MLSKKDVDEKINMVAKAIVGKFGEGHGMDGKRRMCTINPFSGGMIFITEGMEGYHDLTPAISFPAFIPADLVKAMNQAIMDEVNRLLGIPENGKYQTDLSNALIVSTILGWNHPASQLALAIAGTETTGVKILEIEGKVPSELKDLISSKLDKLERQ